MQRLTNVEEIERKFKEYLQAGCRPGDGLDYELFASPLVLGCYVVKNDTTVDVEYGVLNPLTYSERRFRHEHVMQLLDVYKDNAQVGGAIAE